jgi:hypothetical protein
MVVYGTVQYATFGLSLDVAEGKAGETQAVAEASGA